MTKVLLLTTTCLFLGLYTLKSKAQSTSDCAYYQRITCEVKDVSDAADKVILFLNKHASKVMYVNKNINTYSSNVLVPLGRLKIIDSFFNNHFNISQLSLTDNNAERKIDDAKNAIANTQNSIDRTNEQLETETNPNTIRTLKTNLSNYERNLVNQQRNLEKLLEYKDLAFVNVTINQINRNVATTNRNNYKKNSRAYLPGVTYGMLWTENQTIGLSASAYQCYGVQIGLPKNKGIFEVKLAKPSETTDSSTINEMIMVSYGQHIYSQYWKGNSKFFIPYIGYQAGIYIASSENGNNNMVRPNINLQAGFDIYQGNFLTVTNSVAYFVPITNNNHNLRGLMYQAGLSFAF